MSISAAQINDEKAAIPPAPDVAPAPNPGPATRDPGLLLPAFLSLDCDLSALAQQFSVSPADLLAFAKDPVVLDAVRTLKEFACLCFSYRALRARLVAVNTLERITRTTEDPIEQRRAASALVRAATTQHQPPGPQHTAPQSRRRGDADGPAGHSSDPRSDGDDSPLPLSLPDPADSPDQAISAAIAPLTTEDRPTALATLHAHLSPLAQVFGAPAAPDPEDFIADALDSPLGDPIDSINIADSTIDEKTARYTLSLTGPGGPSSLEVRLSKSPLSHLPDCWLITALNNTS